LLAGLLLAITGCAPVVVNTDPDTFPVPAGAASQLRGPQTVELNNVYKTEKQEVIMPRGPTWLGDLKQYTDTAITMLGREMGKVGVNVASPASKTINLRVYNVQAAPSGFVIRASLVLEADYGDGTKSTIKTQNSSPSDAWRAVSGALMFAVRQLLLDQQFVDYVNR